MSIRRSFFAMLSLALVASFAAVQAQDTQYGQGLLLDYYVIQESDEVNEPTGRSMATLIDTSVPQMSYFGPFEIESALEQFQDNLWGLHWHGFLKANEGGPYSFNLLVNTTANADRDYISCKTWTKIQDRIVASHELQKFGNGNKNAYGDIDLQPGIYNFEIWFACNKVGKYISVYEADPSIKVNMRGPNDPMLKPIPTNQLLHEL